MAKVIYRGTHQQVGDLVRRLPAVLAGRAPDTYGLARQLQLRMGVALLSKIQQAFIVKSRGGVGDDGIQWRPLSPRTIAQRRTTAEERRSAGVGGRRQRGLLTSAQDRRWRQIFATRRLRFIATGMNEAEAGARAAAIAWATLKQEGAKTKIGTFGGRKVDVLRDTGELFRSLSPGLEDKPSRASGQVFRVTPGAVMVGTNKKTWHHRGIPGRLPARPLWPTNGQLPVAWQSHLLRVYRRGLLVGLSRIAEGGRV